jgi:hypothetical protein
MNRRTLTTMALLGLAVATALPQAGLTQSNPQIGTWKIDLAKSKFSPGPAPKSATLIFEGVGQGFRATREGTDAQGNPYKAVFGVYFLDGKPYPVTGVPGYDASSYKRVNDSTVEITRTKAGKEVQTATRVLSADGKTLTFTEGGVNANGLQINNVSVWDKQ